MLSSVSSVPSFAPTRYSFARCGMDTVMGGYGAPFHVARRSLLVRSCSIVSPISSGFPLARSLSSHPLIHEARKRKNGNGAETQGNKTRRPTRRNDKKSDETRAADDGDDTRRTSKQQDDRRDGGTRDGGGETPSDENERTTTTTKGNWSRAASFSKHHDTNETRR